MNRTDIYQSPLTGRYASKEMQKIFSDDQKFSTWRKLWVALAKAEQRLGVKEITDEKIQELAEHIFDINYDVARAREREVRHDVMSHVYAYGVQCPKAAGIIHLGATSCFVTDNTDILNFYEALKLVKKRLLGVIKLLADLCYEHKGIATLGYTHFQPASPVTVGKREAIWLQNFMEDLEQLDFVISSLKLLGCRGATGTSSTFMDIFDGDEEKVKELDKIIAEEMGFDKVYPISGQTYTRNLDFRIISVLASINISAQKMAKDIRLQQHDKEIEEPFEKKQIGSSAMAYKRNPMRCERICSLSRYVIAQPAIAAATAVDQWDERTLDDSAVRRISNPEAFLATDAVLIITANIIDGLVVYNKVIEKRLAEELPFMATENIIMEAAKRGGNRQELHEHIRVHSMEAGKRVKLEGKENDLLARIAGDQIFGMTLEEVKEICNPNKLVGRAENQVVDYLTEYVYPVLDKNAELVKDINKEVLV